MTIRGSSQGDYSAAVFVSGGLIDVRNSIIEGGGSEGGNQPGEWAFAVYDFLSNGLTLINNTINGGVATDTAAIWNFAGRRALIEGNRINGEGLVSVFPSRSIGVFFRDTREAILRNNLIEGGIGRQTSTGVYLQENISSYIDPVVQNNTINASGDFQSRGVQLVGSTTPTIDNNIISAGTGSNLQYCITEDSSGSDAAFLRNNLLFDCATGLIFDEVSTNVTDISVVNGLADTTASGNISVDPQFVDRDGADDELSTLVDNDWRLSGSSPPSVTAGGLDLSADFEDDFNDNLRTVNWSIGAYELD